MTCGCKWEVHLAKGCTGEECDFKSLPYEKEAIVKRLQDEAGKMKERRDKLMRGNVDDPEKLMAEVLDVTVGMGIMVKVLVNEFGMTMDEVKEKVGQEKMNVFQKARLAAVVAKMRLKRRGD